jgi:hypothetical protein
VRLFHWTAWDLTTAKKPVGEAGGSGLVDDLVGGLVGGLVEYVG